MRTPADRLLVAVTAAGYTGLVVWSMATFTADHATPYAWMSPAASAASLGRLAGLTAGLLMVGLFVLVGRWPALERALGQDRLLRWHTAVAILLPCLVVLHVSLVVVGGSSMTGESVLAYVGTLVSISVSAAIGAGTVLVVVSVSSMRWVRRRLRYEHWKALHICTYVALAGALAHQVTVGTDLLRNPPLRLVWAAAVLGVLTAAVTFRLVLPVVRSLAADVRIAAVVPQTPRVWSLLLQGDGLAERIGEGGVFCWVRVLGRGTWRQAHPFSVSGIDAHGLVRLTFTTDGDFTTALTCAAPGTRVVVEGPYGRFRATAARTHGPYLLVGVGSGVGAVTGVLPTLEWAGPPHVLIQRVREAHDVLFGTELRRLEDEGRLIHHVVTGTRVDARPRIDDAAQLRALVPDVSRREVWVCGPDALTARVVAALFACGVPRRLVHHERFALGGRRVAAPLAHTLGEALKPAEPARPRR